MCVSFNVNLLFVFCVCVASDDNSSDSPGLPPPILSSSDEDDSHQPPLGDAQQPHPVDLTINIDPNDQDYISKVQQHIFSPEAVKNPLSMQLQSDEKGNYHSPTPDEVITHTEVTDLDDIENGSDSGKALEDAEATPTHKSSLPFAYSGQGTLKASSTLDEGFSPVDVGNELYNLDKTLEDEYEDEEESEEEEEEEESYGSKIGSEEDGGSSRTEDSNLEWIKCITVFEYRASRDDLTCRSGPSDDDELMSYGLLINELEVCSLHSCSFLYYMSS